MQLAHIPVGRNKAYESMSRGRALGSDRFNRDMRLEYNLVIVSRAWDAPVVKDLREVRWQEVLDEAIRVVPPAQPRDERKSADGMVSVAAHMRSTTDATNGWLAQKRKMGSAACVSRHVGLATERRHIDIGKNRRLQQKGEK